MILPLFCYTGIALASTPLTTHPVDSLVELSRQAAYVALFLVGANLLGREDLRSLLWPNAAAGLIVALIGILQYHDLGFVGIPTNGHPSATFGYRNFAAMYLVCALPLAALLFLSTSRFGGVVMSYASTVLMVTYLIYTRTRGAWIGLGAGTLVVAGGIALCPDLRSAFLSTLRLRLDRTKITLLACSVVVFGMLAPLPAGFQDTGLQRFDEKKADITSALSSIFAKHGSRGRTTMWLNTLDLIRDNPLLGSGPGGWPRIYPAYDRGAMIRGNSVPARPHNDYLWIASDYGLVGLTLYVWFLVAGFMALLRLARSSDAFWRVAAPLIAIAVLATLGHAVFSFPRERPQAMMFLYLLFGVVAGAASGGRTVAVPRRFGLPLLGMLLLLIVGTTELSHRQVRFDGHYLRALLAEDVGDWPRARAEAETGLRLGPFRTHMLVILGRAHEKHRRYADAATTYRLALRYEPHSWHAHNGLGIVLKREESYDEALSHFIRALEIAPKANTARTNLGALYRSMGNPINAEREYRTVLQVEPDNAGALNNLGNILKAKGQLDSALVCFKSALEADPRLAQAHYNLGDLLFEAGRYREARTAFESFLRAWKGSLEFADHARGRIQSCKEGI